ncbi:MAG: response regulator [Microcoleaceae cyanobacterium]
MQVEQQQRIMGYFIEEAKDHLDTIEQGLLNLQATIEDPDLLYEVYRAAHSVKGGAAMLGLNSIQATSHRLEDSFKILEKIQEKSRVQVDQKLESLFLEISDTLKALIDSLSSPYGLTEDVAQSLLREAEPIFRDLHVHLGTLAKQHDVTVPELALPTAPTLGQPTLAKTAKPSSTSGTAMVEEVESPQTFFFQHQVPEHLREMLQVFKQPENQGSRQQLRNLCTVLAQRGEAFGLLSWVDCVRQVEAAIANSYNSYQELALVVIPVLKQAKELVLADREAEIEVRADIRNLATLPTQKGSARSNSSVVKSSSSGTLFPSPSLVGSQEDFPLSSILDDFPSAESSFDSVNKPTPKGPQIAPEELKSLADLFEGEDLMEERWGKRTSAQALEVSTSAKVTIDPHQDFLDLFGEENLVSEFQSSAVESTVPKQSIALDFSASEDLTDFDDLLTIGTTSGLGPSDLLDEFWDGSTQQTYDATGSDSTFELLTPQRPPKVEQKQPDFAFTQVDADWFEQLVSGDLETTLLATAAPDRKTDSHQPAPAAEDLFSELFGSSDSEAVLPRPSQAPQADESADFAGLDDLLNQPEGSRSIDIETSLFSDLDAVLHAEEEDERISLDEDADFADLERLLGEEGQTASGFSAGRPRITAKGQRLYEPSAKVPVKQLDDLSNLMGELVVNRNSLEQDQERMRQFLDNLLDQVSLLSDVGQRMQDFYERSLLEISLLSNRKHALWHINSSNRVTDDPLHHGLEFESTELDRFTPFHTLSQEIIELVVRVRESAADIEFLVEEADQVTRQLRQVSTQLEEGLTKARMESFAQEADRLKRPVRDIAIKCGKQADLYVEGRDTLIDKMLLGKLHDPLIHLVNNAITHGIETPDVRVATGKPPVGKITLKIFHQGNQTVISVSDDGAGINTDKVREKAMRKGLITAEQAKAMSNLDVYELLFHPGFSMRDQADEFAGRGVGMDVVRTSLIEVRGSITTDSAVGRGTTFTIRLPLNMSISRALCCISDRARIAFPMDGVEDMIDIPREQIRVGRDGQQTLEWRGTRLPFRHLRDLLVYNRHLGRGNVYGANMDDDMISVIVLRSTGSYLAVQVDQVLIEQEIVIKQLENPVPKPIGIAGATVLGDGQIVAIADVLELIDLAMGRIRRDGAGKIWQSELSVTEARTRKSEPTVLIVDDSITVRSLLSITFEKSGYRVEEARDGKEAWEKLKSGLPCDLVFCDIEMPRMDGLELLSRMQKDATLVDLPIAMLTSRGADRHRQMAYQLGARGYFTKPYLEEQLLEAAQRMLKGEIIGKTTARTSAAPA